MNPVSPEVEAIVYAIAFIAFIVGVVADDDGTGRGFARVKQVQAIAFGLLALTFIPLWNAVAAL